MEKHSEKIPEEKSLQWHPANYAGLQIELTEEQDYLSFEDEHQLGTKPMSIDILIIKNEQEHRIKKNIGRIFRKYNIIEYKSPDDYLSIDDFYKVYGYTCFYKADTTRVNQVLLSELTITFISCRYPLKLLQHLEQERNFTIKEEEPGIYYILGNSIPIQFIVTSKLSMKENLWLKGLTNHLNDYELTAALTKDYHKHKKNTLYQSVMNIIMRANKNHFREANHMCEAMKEFIWEEYGDEIEAAIQKSSNRNDSLIIKLSELGRTEDILKAATNPEYKQQLFKEFGL